MSEPLFRGVLPALVTPFRDGAVDEDAFVRLVERQIAGGVHGLVPVGTTGESATLSHDEHNRVVELCVKTAAGRVPVVAGTGSNSTEEAIELTRHAKAVGADGALVVTPYYNRPSQEGMYAHYAAINEAVQIPILVYNVPTRTGIDISNETLARLAKLPNIVGIKDATGDLARASQQRLMCGEGWVMLTGDDPTALGYIAHGGHGCISVTANVAPDQVSAFFNDALTGQWQGALDEARTEADPPAQGAVLRRLARPRPSSRWRTLASAPRRPACRSWRPPKPPAPRCWPPCGTRA